MQAITQQYAYGYEIPQNTNGLVHMQTQYTHLHDDALAAGQQYNGNIYDVIHGGVSHIDITNGRIITPANGDVLLVNKIERHEVSTAMTLLLKEGYLSVIRQMKETRDQAMVSCMRTHHEQVWSGDRMVMTPVDVFFTGTIAELNTLNMKETRAVNKALRIDDLARSYDSNTDTFMEKKSTGTRGYTQQHYRICPDKLFPIPEKLVVRTANGYIKTAPSYAPGCDINAAYTARKMIRKAAVCEQDTRILQYVEKLRSIVPTISVKIDPNSHKHVCPDGLGGLQLVAPSIEQAVLDLHDLSTVNMFAAECRTNIVNGICYQIPTGGVATVPCSSLFDTKDTTFAIATGCTPHEIDRISRCTTDGRADMYVGHYVTDPIAQHCYSKVTGETASDDLHIKEINGSTLCRPEIATTLITGQKAILDNLSNVQYSLNNGTIHTDTNQLDIGDYVVQTDLPVDQYNIDIVYDEVPYYNDFTHTDLPFRFIPSEHLTDLMRKYFYAKTLHNIVLVKGHAERLKTDSHTLKLYIKRLDELAMYKDDVSKLLGQQRDNEWFKWSIPHFETALTHNVAYLSKILDETIRMQSYAASPELEQQRVNLVDMISRMTTLWNQTIEHVRVNNITLPSLYREPTRECMDSPLEPVRIKEVELTETYPTGINNPLVRAARMTGVSVEPKRGLVLYDPISIKINRLPRALPRKHKPKPKRETFSIPLTVCRAGPSVHDLILLKVGTSPPPIIKSILSPRYEAQLRMFMKRLELFTPVTKIVLVTRGSDDKAMVYWNGLKPIDQVDIDVPPATIDILKSTDLCSNIPSVSKYGNRFIVSVNTWDISRHDVPALEYDDKGVWGNNTSEWSPDYPWDLPTALASYSEVSKEYGDGFGHNYVNEFIRVYIRRVSGKLGLKYQEAFAHMPRVSTRQRPHCQPVVQLGSISRSCDKIYEYPTYETAMRAVQCIKFNLPVPDQEGTTCHPDDDIHDLKILDYVPLDEKPIEPEPKKLSKAERHKEYVARRIAEELEIYEEEKHIPYGITDGRLLQQHYGCDDIDVRTKDRRKKSKYTVEDSKQPQTREELQKKIAEILGDQYTPTTTTTVSPTAESGSSSRSSSEYYTASPESSHSDSTCREDDIVIDVSEANISGEGIIDDSEHESDTEEQLIDFALMPPFARRPIMQRLIKPWMYDPERDNSRPPKPRSGYGLWVSQFEYDGPVRSVCPAFADQLGQPDPKFVLDDKDYPIMKPLYPYEEEVKSKIIMVYDDITERRMAKEAGLIYNSKVELKSRTSRPDAPQDYIISPTPIGPVDVSILDNPERRNVKRIIRGGGDSTMMYSRDKLRYLYRDNQVAISAMQPEADREQSVKIGVNKVRCVGPYKFTTTQYDNDSLVDNAYRNFGFSYCDKPKVLQTVRQKDMTEWKPVDGCERVFYNIGPNLHQVDNKYVTGVRPPYSHMVSDGYIRNWFDAAIKSKEQKPTGIQVDRDGDIMTSEQHAGKLCALLQMAINKSVKLETSHRGTCPYIDELTKQSQHVGMQDMTNAIKSYLIGDAEPIRSSELSESMRQYISDMSSISSKDLWYYIERSARSPSQYELLKSKLLASKMKDCPAAVACKNAIPKIRSTYNTELLSNPVADCNIRLSIRLHITVMYHILTIVDSLWIKYRTQRWSIAEFAKFIIESAIGSDLVDKGRLPSTTPQSEVKDQECYPPSMCKIGNYIRYIK